MARCCLNLPNIVTSSGEEICQFRRKEKRKEKEVKILQLVRGNGVEGCVIGMRKKISSNKSENLMCKCIFTLPTCDISIESLVIAQNYAEENVTNPEIEYNMSIL